jgi:tetratricopeptide (TPR) repeat protein
MKTFCDYHPTKPAQWCCPECDAYYCPGCISKRVIEQYGKKKTFYYCPKCNEFPKRLAIGNVIEPFWSRLPKFFTYPFHPRPLVFMAALSLATLLYGIPLLGLFLRLATYVVLLKYSFAALLNTAQGKFFPPNVNLQTISADIGVVFKQIAIFIIIGILFVYMIRDAGIIVGLFFLCFAILSIPSMIIMLVTTNSLLHAINPLLFVKIAWRIGWGYLLMYFFLILLGGAPAVIGKYAIAYLPAPLYMMLMTLAESFYTIITYHLMGYVILQYNEEIGYEVELEDDPLVSEEGPSAHSESSEITNRVDILIKEGNMDEAISVIKKETEGDITDPELAERYFNLLKIKKQVQEMLEHGRVYLDMLAKANQKEKLCEVYLECASKNSEFTPGSSTIMKIAGSLNESGKPKEAVQAYNNFIKANPKSPMVPKAYFLGSNIINEKLNNPQKASSIIKGLIKKYPDHEIIPYADRYLKQLKLS